MEERKYKDGDLLLKQGEAGGYVLQITSGEVEVFLEQNAGAIVLGSVEAGGFLGEMGVIEGYTVHGASARARGAVATRQMDREEFLRLVSADDDLAYGLIERLISRLRATNERLASSATPRPQQRSSTITIHADSLPAKPHVPPDGLQISNLPFTVGRNSRRRDTASSPPNLLVEDGKPFRISRRHFVIDHSDEDVVVYDLESTLGTEVNGEAIGKHFGKDYASLQAGENTILAGGNASPFVFRVVLK
jgi:hypothetical protein